jgi:ribosomal protein L24
MKLKVNDTVKIITGKDKGKTGKITKVLPEKIRSLSLVSTSTSATLKNVMKRLLAA